MEEKVVHLNTIASVLIRGVAGAATVESMPELGVDDISKIGQLLIQLAIGVATLFSIFRKAKQPQINVQSEVKEKQV